MRKTLLLILILFVALTGCTFYREHGESHITESNYDIGDYMAQEQYEEMNADPGNTDIGDEGPIYSEMEKIPFAPVFDADE
ncbi:MAG: hypothetical protein P9M13_01340 [Candidatus Ancaeobacter aquaticus]|nr:hypothetical protein [Candidatus Ancaeobacter aquaticus]